MPDTSLLIEAVAYICAIWSFVVFLVQSLGISRMWVARPRVVPARPPVLTLC